jgi:hypothetical protein
MWCGISDIEADQIKFHKLETALLIWLKKSGIHKGRNFMSISTQKDVSAVFYCMWIIEVQRH